MLNWLILDPMIRNALEEDLSGGDVTTQYTVPAGRTCSGRLIAKMDGVVCGLPVFQRVLDLVGEMLGAPDAVDFQLAVAEGDVVATGAVLATIEGPAAVILSAERVALNLLQHLSGIATMTAEASKAVAGTKTRIIDTRKTTPGLRWAEKYAVRTGGGTNHRFNLSDGILIKDNHIVAAGGIKNAVQSVKDHAPHTLRIEVETETMDQVREALDAGADIIMFDNMSNEQMKEAVDFLDGRALSEASGNMGEKDLAAVAATGVNYISIGALTHSVTAMDISLKFDRM